MIAGRRERHLHRRRRLLLHRPAALQRAVRRPAVLRDQGRQDHEMIEDVAYQIRTPEFWNSCVGRLRRERLPPRRLVLRRQGPAGPGRRRSRTARARRASTASTSSTPLAAWVERRARKESGMSIFTEQDARAILDKVVALSKADECTATLAGAVNGNIRFALNNVTTSGVVSDAVSQCRSPTASASASPRSIIRRRVAGARRAPRGGAGKAGAGKRGVHAGAREADATRRRRRYDASVAAITPEYRAEVAAASIAPCRADKLVAAGFLTDGAGFVRLRQQQRQFRLSEGDRSRLHLHRAHRRRQRLGLGRPQRPARRTFDADADIRIAHRQGQGFGGRKALEPGKYPVILEPAAAAGPDLFDDVRLRRAPGRRRPQLPRRRRAAATGWAKSVRRARQHLREPADADVPVLPWDGKGCRASRRVRRQGQGRPTCSTRATGPSRKKQGRPVDARQRHHGRRHEVDGGPDQVARRRASWSRAPGTSAWSIRRRCC